MTIVRRSLAEIKSNPRRFTDSERERLVSMTEDEIEANALADSENPPWTDDELAEARRERDRRFVTEKRSA